MSALLLAVRGALTGRRFPLADQPLILGRAPDCHIVVENHRASRHHARLSSTAAGYVLEDLGSSNGTLVNGQRIQSCQLNPGDLIEIGDDLFRFEPSSAAQDATVIGMPQPVAPPAGQGLQPLAMPQPPVPQPPVPQPVAPPAYAPIPPPAVSQQPPAGQGMPPAYAPPTAPVVPPAYAPPTAPVAPAKRSGAGCMIGIVAVLAILCIVVVGGVYLLRDQIGKFVELPFPDQPPVQVTISGDTGGSLTTPGGVRIEVPRDAIPRNADGQAGKLEFGVVEAQAEPVLPDEFAAVGRMYQFEPEGVQFERPVRISLPIPADVDPARVLGLTTLDPASNRWILVPATIDLQARAVVADVLHFSPYGIYGLSGSQDPEAWNRTNGGWIRALNNQLDGSNNYPGGRFLPRLSVVGACIQGAVLDDPGLADFMPSPGDWNIMARSRPNAAAPRGESRFWFPAGTYTIVEYVFLSEINSSPGYLPEYGWWAKAPRRVRLDAGTTLTFEPFDITASGVTALTSFDNCWGTPRTPTAGQPTLPPGDAPPPFSESPVVIPGDATPTPDSAPLPIPGACSLDLAGEWDMQITLRSTNDPNSQESIGDTEGGPVYLSIDGDRAVFELENAQLSGVCSQHGARIVIEGQAGDQDESIPLRFELNQETPDRLSGTLHMENDEYYIDADVLMTR